MSQSLSTLAVGAKIKDTTTKYYGQPIVWRVIGKDHDGAGTVTLLADKILKICCFDAKEPNNSNSDRKNYGNNRYLHSNLLQWLNSDAAAGQWYSAKHTADQAPSSTTYTSNNPYSGEAGFLNGFSANFKASLQSKAHITALNTVTDGGGSENVTSKVFLLSNTEMGLANENNIAEGSLYTGAFSDNASRVAYPTAEAVANSDYTNSSLNTSAGWYYWLRTTYASNASSERSVNIDGSLDYNLACGGSYGVRPACVVLSTLKVSDSPDGDGVYTVQWNAAPTITTASTALGDKNGAFSVDFIINDAESDATTGKVELLNSSDALIETLIPSYEVNLGETKTASVSYALLTTLTIGATYKIKITAQDSSNTSTKVITFTRSQSTVLIDGADGDLGNKWLPFSQSYVVNDTASEDVTVVESIDGETVRTFQASLGSTNTFDMTGWENWDSEMQHTLTVSATNTSQATAIRTWTFTKLHDKLRFTTNPIPTDIAAEEIYAQVNYSGGELMIEASNDSGATWEDITTEVEAGESYVFTNEPDSSFGVSVRVTQTKDADTERVYCYAVAFTYK